MIVFLYFLLCTAGVALLISAIIYEFYWSYKYWKVFYSNIHFWEDHISDLVTSLVSMTCGVVMVVNTINVLMKEFYSITLADFISQFFN